MEEVLHQIFSLKGSWTLSVASLRIGCHLEVTSHRICWAWKEPLEIILSNFPTQNRVIRFIPDCLGTVQSCLQYLEGWRLCSLWTTRFKWNFPSFHLFPLLLLLSLRRVWPCVLFSHTSSGIYNIGKISLTFSRLNYPSFLSLASFVR